MAGTPVPRRGLFLPAGAGYAPLVQLPLLFSAAGAVIGPGPLRVIPGSHRSARDPSDDMVTAYLSDPTG